MRKLLILFLVLLFSSLSASDIEKDLAQARKNLGNLVVGQGLADTEAKADQIALQDLTSQIMVTVKSSFVDSAKEDGVTVEEYCERVVKTYSEVELFEAKKLSEKVCEEFKVYRYITAENMKKVFKQRENQILNLILAGESALSKNNITDALRNYYWALLLLKSHPESKSLMYPINEQNKLLHLALPIEMERILSGIKIELINIKTEAESNCSDVVLQASYDGNLVCGLLIDYHDGYDLHEPTKWTNGIEILQINNIVLENQHKLTFRIDYTFANHSFLQEISSSIDNIEPINLEYAIKDVFITEEDVKKHQESDDDLLIFDSSVDEANAKIVNNIITAISERNLISVRRDFTTEGFKQFNSLMGYGNAVVIPIGTRIKQINIADNKIVRSIPMKFNFASSNEDFTEGVNFIFDKDGKVDGVSFALSSQASSDIVNKDFATEEEKAIIINFIEQYKTAYCLKDLEFIENVFSNDALIIVGKMVRSEPDQVNDSLYGQLTKSTVEYVKLNKKNYINRLSAQFKSKEFINLHFLDNSVDRVMSRGNKVFGIQIAQYYYSSNYKDSGYLFLMFDLQDIDHPKIMVRSWQPEKSADGAIIGMENFQWE